MSTTERANNWEESRSKLATSFSSFALTRDRILCDSIIVVILFYKLNALQSNVFPFFALEKDQTKTIIAIITVI